MKTPAKYQPVTALINNLSELCDALVEGKRKCEEIASKISNEQVRKTIFSLEQLNIQYAKELNAQIQSLGGESKNTGMNTFQTPGAEKQETSVNVKKETLHICTKVEYPIIKLYRKILRQPLLNSSLKGIIQYQMNGIMCTTLQLKLLSNFLQGQDLSFA
jgi:hypothetical protein